MTRTQTAHRGERRHRRWVLPAMGAAALLLLAWVAFQFFPTYRWQSDMPMGVEDLRLNGRLTTFGELADGQTGPRGLQLSMPFDQALTAFPSATSDEALPEEAFSWVYGEWDAASGLPTAPCAVLTVEEGALQLRVLTLAGPDGQYGLLLCEVDPDAGNLSAVRWRMTSTPDILQAF